MLVNRAKPIASRPEHAPAARQPAPGWPHRGAVDLAATLTTCVLLSFAVINGGAALVPGAAVSVMVAAAMRVTARGTRPAPAASVLGVLAVAAVGSVGAGLAGAVLAVDASWQGLAMASAAALAAAVSARALALVEAQVDRVRRRIVLIGDGAAARALGREAARSRLPIEIVAVVEVTATTLVDELNSALDRGPATVALMRRALEQPGVVDAVLTARARSAALAPLSEVYERTFGLVPLGEIDRGWFVREIAEDARPLYRACKRAVDVLVAGCLLVLSAPLWPVLALAVRASGPGVLYRQRRLGKHGALIEITKFRTMRPVLTPLSAWATLEDHRVTRAGRAMRRYRLDELPQLWDVLRGRLSLVGPRPEQPELAAALAERVEHFRMRELVRPGLTGWAQVTLPYGGCEETSQDKLSADLYYLRHQSLLLDLRILARTVGVVLQGRGL